MPDGAVVGLVPSWYLMLLTVIESPLTPCRLYVYVTVSCIDVSV